MVSVISLRKLSNVHYDVLQVVGRVQPNVERHARNRQSTSVQTPRTNLTNMRSLQMLHLHPLTLEDILHQETREKLELFPRLGYYFIVFRALESDRTRAKATQLSLNLSANGDGKNMVPISRGSMGATNVYIAVFRDGICTVGNGLVLFFIAIDLLLWLFIVSFRRHCRSYTACQKQNHAA